MPITQNLSDIFIQTLEQAVDGVVVIDTKNCVVLFNLAAEKLWGFDRSEVIGQNVKMLVPEAIRNKHDDYVDSNRRTGVNKIVGTTRDVPIHRKDGSQRWGAMSISRVESEGQVLFTAFVKDVTVHRKEQKRIKLLSLVADQTENAIVITDNSWKIVYVNRGFERIFGYAFSDVEGLRPAALLTPQLSESNVSAIHERLSRGLSLRTEELTLIKNGERIWSNIAISPILSGTGELTNTVTVLADVTSLKIHEVLQFCILDAMVREMPLEAVMDLVCSEVERIAPEVKASVIQVDEDGCMHLLSAPSLPATYAKIIEGMSISDCIGSSSTAAFLGESVVTSDIETDSTWAVIRDDFLPLGINSCWSTPIKGARGVSIGVLVFYYDEKRIPSPLHQQMVDVITPLCALAMEREANQENIRKLAFYDSLTELPNRSLLHAKADHALIEAKRTKTSLAVLFIDLDRFKQVNDSLGHPAGDELLKVIAERLHSNRRSTDIVGRLSGDEFVVVLPNCSSDCVIEIVEEIKLSISKPCQIAGSSISPSASIGISIYPQDGHDMGTLIHRADMAMYQAKGVGRGRFSFFSYELNQLAQERQALESALRHAIDNGELRLNYQPQVNMDDGKLYGVEALARWTHSKFGEVSPARFIPLAEECGLIGELGNWAVQEACRQLAVWRRKGLKIPSVSVNLSPSNFHNLDLTGMIMRTLDQHNLIAADLTLELTESVLLDTNPSTMKVLHEVHSQGVKLAMDDFGTGYSSLSYLRKLPIQELKLDRSFVMDLEADETSRALSDAVLRIGDSLRLKVVAEGVEEQGQYKILKEQGYHVAQGYLLSKPLNPQDLEVWMDKYRGC
ncbi:EAL domain-containing protein [Pseudomonas lactis]|uniref:EAL domain-containing protein n=1 Tax=Pseudomonas lactis TaxID=1615674 RepID=UPI00110CA2E4|nr:EAL domain-containing protein [Pseudomonas lactis]